MTPTDAKRFCPDCGLEITAAEASRGCPHCLLRLALTAEEDTALLERKATEAPPLPSGLRTRFFADYEILSEIARGGMGVVYKARQLSLNRLVALKMIQASHLFSPEARLRFQMEVSAVAQLDHPHIVPLYQTGEHEGTHYFTMRLVEGGSLASPHSDLQPTETETGSPPSGSDNKARNSKVAGLVRKVARAVHYAHQRGVLHRDLKPSNILLDTQHEPHVADFGLAKMLARESGFTFTESILGSPNYMAPEQAAGQSAQLTVAADVYGLGAILFELLAGRPPFKAATPLETIRKVCDEEPQPPRKFNPAADPDLETICLKCLQKDPAARYASAAELAEDLDRWVEGKPILARPVGRLEQVWRWCKRQPALASAVAVSVLLLLALAIGTAIAGVRIRRAERQAALNLRESLLGQARLVRLSSEMGQRTEGLRLLRQAASLGGPPEFRERLRDELLATLALSDMPFAGQKQLRGASLDPVLTLFDPAFELHASVLDGATVVIRRVADGQELRRFQAGPSPVKQLEQFSHNGQYLGLRHADGISIWDTETGELSLATNGANRVFAFAPNKPLLALEEWGLQISIRAMPDGREIRRIETEPEPVRGRQRRWGAMAFLRDGRRLAAVRSPSRNNVIELFQFETGGAARYITNAEPVRCLAWNPRSSYFAAGTADSKIRLWDPYNGRLRSTLTLPAPARSLVYSPDGTLLAAACEDRVIRLWHSHGAKPIFSALCDGHRIAFSPDGRRVGPVIRGDEIGWLELTRPPEFVDAFLSNVGGMKDCQFDPLSRVLAVSWGGGVGFCDARDLRALDALPVGTPGLIRFDPRGEAVFGGDTNGIARWATRWAGPALVERGKREDLLTGAGWSALTFSVRGDWFAAANTRSNAAYVFDRSLTNRLATLAPHPGVESVALSPHGLWAATGSSRDRQVRVWDARSGEKLLEVPTGASPRAAFSADGKWLATFGDTFELREVGSWKLAPPLPFPEGRPLLGAAAFSPDGRLLALVRDQYAVQLFDLATFRPLGILSAPDDQAMHVLEFSPDGSRLGAGCVSGWLRVWDLRRIRQRLAEFELDWGLPPLSHAATLPAAELRWRALP